MPSEIAGYAAVALDSLSKPQISFIQGLGKAELHAHLNGSIPLPALRNLARNYSPSTISSEEIQSGIERLQNLVELNEIHDFFGLFRVIYALTATPSAVSEAARAVLSEFLDGITPQCTYLELRSTPRATSSMTLLEYVQSVLDEVERYPDDKAALIISLNRTMDDKVMEECVSIAARLKSEGRRVVGVDLCGDPLVCLMWLHLLSLYFLHPRHETSQILPTILHRHRPQVLK